MSVPQTLPKPPNPPGAHFTLRKLSPKHRNIASLLAQGLGRGEISKIVHCVPEYVTMLAKQPLFQDYVKDISAFVDTRMRAMHEKSVDVLGQLLQTGTEDTKLRAAQTVMKAIGKDGQKDIAKVSVNFVVQVPAKAASTRDWEKVHSRKPVTIEQE